MRYEMMRPGQIREAVRNKLPLLMPVGVIEYHGLHNPVGTDALITQGLVHEIERRVACVVAPTMFYGFTGEWAGGPELGEIHMDGEPLYRFVKPVLKAFFLQGWRRIYIICHHQGPKGITHLAYQRAATECTMEAGRDKFGAGWWQASKDGFDEGIFETFQVVSADEYAPGAGYRGHGGRDETSAMMHFHPDSVNLAELKLMTPLPYWAEDAAQSSAGNGREIAERLVAAWVAHLKGDR